MSLGFKITNELLNRGYIIPDVLPSEVQCAIEKLLPPEEASGEIFVVYFGRGDDDWILASRGEVGKHLSPSCVNRIYPLQGGRDDG